MAARRRGLWVRHVWMRLSVLNGTGSTPWLLLWRSVGAQDRNGVLTLIPQRHNEFIEKPQFSGCSRSAQYLSLIVAMYSRRADNDNMHNNPFG